METPEAINFINALIPFGIIVFVIAMGVVLLNQQFRKSLYRQQLEQQELKHAHQKDLLKTAIEVQDNERKRIAQDIHDELGAALSMGRMQLVQLEKQPELLDRRLPFIRELMENALSSTRRISHELMPLHFEEKGLNEALQKLLEQAEAAGGVSSTLEVPDPMPSLSAQQNLWLYRVAAELLNNSLKHAKASHVSIQLHNDTPNLTFRYEDDGQGLPEQPSGTSETLGQGGIGLKGLEGRVSAMDGKLEYGNRALGGFYAIIRVPLV